MQTTQIDLVTFGSQHLEGALALSRQAGWPHRLEDWQMMLALSKGVVALDGERVVGTTLATLYGDDCATINMVIVDESMRGRGLGRSLMDFGMGATEGRQCRLVATKDGMPLYQKLGFRETGTILQHQGISGKAEAPRDIEWADPSDVPAIAALDLEAFGADRSGLIAYLDKVGRFAVLRRDNEVKGFAALRHFGRGEVIGPVVADTADEARKLILFMIAARPDTFLRVDTTADTGLSAWLTEQGFAHVGGGTAMVRGDTAATETRTVHTFALANQALG